jgi:hypothetical protein
MPLSLIVDLEYATLWGTGDHLELRYPEGGKRVFFCSVRELLAVLGEELQEGRVIEPVEGFKMTLWRAAYREDVLVQLDIGSKRSWPYRSCLVEGLRKCLEIQP